MCLKCVVSLFFLYSQQLSLASNLLTRASLPLLQQNQMSTPPSLPASSPTAQSASTAPGLGTPGGPMGPGSASGAAGPLPNLPPSSTPSQPSTYPHCPPIRTNSPSPARSITPQPHQTPPALPRSQTPQPQTPGTPQLPPPQQQPPLQQDSQQQQQQLGKGVNSDKSSQHPQLNQAGVPPAGPQAPQASLLPTQNAHVPMQLPQTPVSKYTPCYLNTS